MKRFRHKKSSVTNSAKKPGERRHLKDKQLSSLGIFPAAKVYNLACTAKLFDDFLLKENCPTHSSPSRSQSCPTNALPGC